MNTCIYILVDEDSNSWECSQCREWWMLTSGSPEDNEMKFCPKCGTKIIESKIETVDKLIKEIDETFEESIPYFTISKSKIDNSPVLGDTVKCKVCGEYHDVEHGDVVKKDGSKEKSKLLAFIKCPQNGKDYLVGINGKEI